MPGWPSFKKKPYYEELTAFMATTHDMDTGELLDSAVQEKVAAAIAAEPTVVAAAESAVNATGIAQQAQNAFGRVFDVKSYGATGDGVTDDTAAIDLAMQAADAAGGGIVYFGHGTYLVNPFEVPGYAGFKACVQVPTRTHVQGAGMGATVIKLAGGQTDTSVYKIIGNTELDGGDEDISIADLTVDGNNVANAGNLAQGVMMLRVRGVRMDRVRALNVYGYDPYPPGETFGLIVSECVDVRFSDCEAVGTAGDHGSGFGDNSSTNVVYDRCVARGMGSGMGYASWYGSNVSFLGSFAYDNAANGFNVEYGRDVLFSACHAGGNASVNAAGNAGMTTLENLGNTGSGFVINATKRAVLAGCHSRNNGNNGLSVVSSPTTTSTVQLRGGTYRDNTNAEVYFGPSNTSQEAADAAAASVRGSRISAETDIGGSGSADITINAVNTPAHGSFGWTGTTYTMPMPASGTPMSNPFPFPVGIYVVSTNTYFIMVGGATLGITNGYVRLNPGDTIQINYGTAPTWIWVRA